MHCAGANVCMVPSDYKDFQIECCFSKSGFIATHLMCCLTITEFKMDRIEIAALFMDHYKIFERLWLVNYSHQHANPNPTITI